MYTTIQVNLDGANRKETLQPNEERVFNLRC